MIWYDQLFEKCQSSQTLGHEDLGLRPCSTMHGFRKVLFIKFHLQGLLGFPVVPNVPQTGIASPNR